MSHIIATTKSGMSIIVDSFVTNSEKALEYWKKFGMQNVTYSVKKLSKADLIGMDI
jgi:hypothetical protein